MRIYYFVILVALLCACATTHVQAQVVSTVLIEQLDGSHWENYQKDTGYIYNSDCNELYQLQKMWDSATNNWNNYFQVYNSYYTSGKEYQDSEQLWNTPFAGWNNYCLVTFTYDGSNYLITESLQLWNTATTAWQNYSQTIYSNNTDGTAHVAYNLVWSGGTWDTSNSVTYIYNTPGQLDTELVTVRLSLGTWQNSERFCYSYISGNKTSQLTQSWNTGTHSWQNTQLQNYFPDWTTRDSEKISNWNSSSSTWDTVQRFTFTYMPCTPAAVGQVAPADPIAVYPNPCTGHFTVTGLTQGQSVEIYNYTGQRIDSRTTDNTAMNFNIADYASGLYLVRVHNQDGSMATQEKIVKTQ